MNRGSTKSRKVRQASWRIGAFGNHLYENGTDYDEYCCGMDMDTFNFVLATVKVSVEEEKAKDGGKTRARYLCLAGCLALTLEFLRHAMSVGGLANKHRLSTSCVDRTVQWMVIHMRASLEGIQSPAPGSPATQGIGRFCSCGCIDCCTHERNRVHPGEDTLYRTDKACHFLTSQVVVDHTGYIMRLSIARGHHNDQAMKNMTRMAEWLEERQMAPLLADLGYSGAGTIRPLSTEDMLDNNMDPDMLRSNRHHGAERSQVENVNSWFKCWKFASAKCALTVEFQAIALIVCGMLTNITFKGADPLTRARILSR